MSQTMHITDQLNRAITLDKTPERIISVVPSITELLVDLGLEEHIVGLTKFCIHPEEFKTTKTVIGGTKQVKIEKIRALQPDLILCNKEENTREMIEELSAIAAVHVSDIYTLEDSFDLIHAYGKIFKKQNNAQQLIMEIQQARAAFRSQNSEVSSGKVAYFIWKEPWMVAAKQTFIDSMITEAGFDNVFGKEQRYPEISLQDPRLAMADLIFLSSEPYPFKETHVATFQSKFPDKDVRIVNGEMFSWYGSRMRLAFDYFWSLKEKSV